MKASHMLRRISRIGVVLWIGFAWFQYAQTACGEDRVKIDVRSRPAVTRNEILKYTPIGSSADDVAEFILSRLYFEGGYTSGIGTMPRPGVSVVLGHRSSNSGVSHTAIRAQWIFNEKLKLQDVQIEAMSQEGSFAPGKAADNSPKVRVDLLQSDEAIRRQLLVYTPVGSGLTTIFAFLGRLHYLGGPVSGVALTGKRGVGVVLGHAIESSTGRDKLVQVNWAQDERDNLAEIEIRRVDWPPGSGN